MNASAGFESFKLFSSELSFAGWVGVVVHVADLMNDSTLPLFVDLLIV